MTLKEVHHIELAATILTYGTRYEHTITCEGDAESGPYALTYRGLRMGKAKLELSPNGTVTLLYSKPTDPELKPWLDRRDHRFATIRNTTVGRLLALKVA